MKARPIVTAAALFATGIVLAAFAAPYLYGEYALREAHDVVSAPLTTPVAGRWADDYFVVETIDAATFAIGEPRYHQANYSYLILGAKRAVLFDAGTGMRDIVPVVRSLTPLPVTVIPSHLHFDHVGALGRFDRTALIDDPSLRARVVDSSLTPQRYEFLGFGDHLLAPTFRVDEWWAPETNVDLGDRILWVVATPGHTPTSVSLHDRDRHQLFVGDYLYPGRLYAQLPGASRSAYLASARRLLTIVDSGTRIYTAHMAKPPAPARAPVLEVADLKALERSLIALDAGHLEWTGFYPRIYAVRGIVTFATGFPWNNR
jgi:glyoxylase-like metal-dependent hydrolase (beta-lactamase superfamily II)